MEFLKITGQSKTNTTYQNLKNNNKQLVLYENQAEMVVITFITIPFFHTMYVVK